MTDIKAVHILADLEVSSSTAANLSNKEYLIEEIINKMIQCLGGEIEEFDSTAIEDNGFNLIATTEEGKCQVLVRTYPKRKKFRFEYWSWNYFNIEFVYEIIYQAFDIVDEIIFEVSYSEDSFSISSLL